MVIALLASLALIAPASGRPQRLAFSGVDHGKMALVVANLDGSGARRITDGSVHDEDPAWSPDGKWIAFSRPSGGRGGEAHSLWIVRPDGSGLARLTSGPGDDSFRDWAADGKSVTFYRYGGEYEDYSVDLARKEVVPVLHPGWWYSSSPEGKWIVYIHYATGDDGVYEGQAGGDLWLTDSVGHAGRRLTNLHGDASEPDWSPDGRAIAFPARTGDVGKLCVVAIPDGKVRVLSSERGASYSDAFWSPDGKRIAFTTSRGPGRSQLWVVNASGGGRRLLSRGAGSYSGPEWTADGRLMALVVLPSHRGGRVVSIDVRSGAERIVRTSVPVASFDISR